MKVCKFGGSSLTDARCVKRVADIVLGDCERKIIVLSAPGKRGNERVKITDRLIDIYNLIRGGKQCEKLWQNVADRFEKMQNMLGVHCNAVECIADEKKCIDNKSYAEFVSLGERLTAKIFSSYTGYEYIDAKDIIFRRGKEYHVEKDRIFRALKCADGVVIPGFYFSDEEGKTALFERGGGDMTGAVIACALGIEYENFTDTDGIYTAIPDGDTPIMIDTANYADLTFLSGYGFTVFSGEASGYLAGSGVKTRVYNTFTGKGGTLIADRLKTLPFAIAANGEKGEIAVICGENYKRAVLKILSENHNKIHNVRHNSGAIIISVDAGLAKTMCNELYKVLANICKENK